MPNHSKIKHIAILFVVVSILVYGGSLFFQEKAEAAPNSTVYFEPASKTVNNNSTFSLEAKVSPGTNQVYAAALRVSFDPTKVRITSITENSSVFGQVIAKSTPDNANATGTASIDLMTALAADRPVITSPTTIATFTFQAIGNGSNSISFTDKTVIGAVGESGNVVTTTTPATIVVSARTYSLADWTNIATHWLQPLSGESNGDYNGDSMVNTRDIGIIMHSWQ
jgi:hypothetical protein